MTPDWQSDLYRNEIFDCKCGREVTGRELDRNNGICDKCVDREMEIMKGKKGEG